MALDIDPLEGPRRGSFLMSEVPLQAAWSNLLSADYFEASNCPPASISLARCRSLRPLALSTLSLRASAVRCPQDRAAIGRSGC